MVLFASSREFYGLLRQISDKADKVELQAKGGSMYPFVRSGDWVTIELNRNREAKKGDIILFKKDESLYMHRVLDTSPEGIIAKGDMSFDADGFIPSGDIIGRLVSIRRNGRHMDLSSEKNRLISAVISDASRISRYPVLFLRKVYSSAVLIFLFMHNFSLWRKFLKKIVSNEGIVREALEEDVEDIRDLFITSGEDFKKVLIDIKKEGFWLVFERDGKVAAAMTITRYTEDPSLWLIFGLEVKFHLRGLGIAERLARYAMERAGEEGASRVGLFVNKRSRPAIALYKKLGFHEEEDFPARFYRSPDELYLVYRFNN